MQNYKFVQWNNYVAMKFNRSTMVIVMIVVSSILLLPIFCNSLVAGDPLPGSSDEDDLPDYMQNWEIMEPVFSLYNTELGNYIIEWSWNQDDAEGVVYYLEEAQTQDFHNANITTHHDTSVLMTGKPNGTYWYRVKAVKGNLSSVWSQPDSISISIKTIDDGVIVHDYHKDVYDVPYLKEKLEFFLNVPMVVQIGDDPDTSVKYTMTMLECTTSEFYNVSILEVHEPHQYITVTSEESEIDIDQDGMMDLTVQFKSQHELGQVYIYFKIIDNSGPAIPYSTIGVIMAIVLAITYLFYTRWVKHRPSVARIEGANTPTLSDTSEIEKGRGDEIHE